MEKKLQTGHWKTICVRALQSKQNGNIYGNTKISKSRRGSNLVHAESLGGCGGGGGRRGGGKGQGKATFDQKGAEWPGKAGSGINGAKWRQITWRGRRR